MSDDKFLEVKKLASEIRDFYKQDTRQDSFNLLLCGDKGSGKTVLSTTCRKPVHIDSFDSGGTKALKPWIEKGEIIADTRWEGDDPFKPTVFEKWQTEMAKRILDYSLEKLTYEHFKRGHVFFKKLISALSSEEQKNYQHKLLQFAKKNAPELFLASLSKN